MLSPMHAGRQTVLARRHGRRIPLSGPDEVRDIPVAIAEVDGFYCQNNPGGGT